MPQGDQADLPGPLAGEPRERALAFTERPARFGADTPEDVTRRTLLVGGASIAPNTFVLGIDPERDVAVLHQLVAEGEGEGT